MSGIVVGVDGSESSRLALDWAVDEARRRGVRLEVVYAYEHTPSWMAYGADESMSQAQMEAIRDAVEESTREAARHAQGLVDQLTADIDGLEMDALAIESNRPAETLIERAQEADLLVVGSRGRGGFASLMLGSVSQQCATHAECPVVIVR
jgi:nucleotide-binding universal stress UspA family protein